VGQYLAAAPPVFFALATIGGWWKMTEDITILTLNRKKKKTTGWLPDIGTMFAMVLRCLPRDALCRDPKTIQLPPQVPLTVSAL
jgi:hypothetical protein